MSGLRRFLWTVAAGGFAGAVVAVFFSPALIEWYFTPPAEIGISCKKVVPWTIQAYQRVILAGILMGAILSLLLFFVFNRSKKKQDLGSITNTELK